MAVGIICEYNPFHNGHLYHLNKIKEQFKNEEIILILGGNFLQRGNPSIIDKYCKNCNEKITKDTDKNHFLVSKAFS